MGKKSGPKAPKPPDPYKTADAQGQMNKETAIAIANLNRINQYSPYGNLEYRVVGTNPDGTPKYEQTMTLSGSGQRQLDQQNALAEALNGFASGQLNRVSTAVNTPFNFDGAPGQVTNVNTNGLPSLVSTAGNIDMTRNINGAGDIIRSLGNTGNIQSNLDFGGLQDIPGLGDFSGDRTKVENALYQRAASRLDPRFNQQQSDMEASLANQGIAKGSEAFNRELDNFNRAKNDAYGSAAWDAINAGGAEQSRLFGMGLTARQQGVSERGQQGEFANNAQAQRFAQALSGGQFGNQAQQQQYDQNSSNAAFYNESGEALFQQALANAGLSNAARTQGFNESSANAALQNQGRQQYITEASYLRNLPLSDIATLMGTAGAPTQPNFNPVAQTNVANTDLMGAVYDTYNANMNQWSQQQAQRANTKGQMMGAVGTGAGMLAMSDRRVKHTIKRIGETADGVATYVFSYIGEKVRRFGVMAQEVMHIPNAVYRTNDGTLVVDYGKVW